MSTLGIFLGSVVLKRARGGDDVKASLRAGDKVSVRGTQIWSTGSTDTGAVDRLRQEGSAHPSWSLYLTFPNEVPEGDTIRL